MKLRNIITILASAALLTACDDVFTPAPENMKDIKDMENDPIMSEGFVLTAYRNLPNYEKGTGTDVATDDAVTNEKGANWSKYATGSWTVQSWDPTGRWNNDLSSMQYLYIFLNSNVAKTEFLKNPYENQLKQRRLTGEAYGLLATHAYYLLRAHAGYDNSGKLLGSQLFDGYVGTDGDHQDEFLRGNRPRDLLRNSIVTPSLLASILNVKYVNSSALHRIEQEFQRNGVNISRQTMSNWIVRCSQMYFTPFVERMKQELLSLHVTQSDETPTQVIADSDHPNSKCYMWVHRSGEFYTRRPIVIYEYQKGRDHQKPLDFYKDYKGILVTDSLQQYHLVDKKLPDVTNANCWAHARRDFADAVKAADKKDPSSVRQSVAYQALQKIAGFYNADTELKGLSSEERLQKRQELIRPLVEEFFAWVKQQVNDCAVPPKSKKGQGLNFIINQEKYLKVFLEDGDAPIDNSASERAIRTFCLGKKNWMFHNTAKGASASAMVYSISETAKLNNLRPYYYFKYILTELPKLCEEKENIDPEKLDYLMPWSDSLPDECRKPRRQ